MKKIGIIIVVGLILLGSIICFVLALNRTKKSNISSSIESSGESASTISNSYQSTNYGSEEEYNGTTITKSGTYTIEGDNNQIVIDTDSNVELILKNATITSSNGPAIYVKDAKTVNIILEGTNKISSTTTTELDGAIYSTADLIFNGDGTIEVTSNIDGIVSKDTLVINSGTYIINSGDDGIRGKDYVAIVNGTFTIDAKGDGIKSTNEEDSSMGYVSIDKGSFTINAVNDGIDASTEVNIKDGTFNITTTSKEDDSSKGIKGDTKIIISGGVFNIDSTDDGIHSNGDIAIKGGTIKVDSGDDAIHADGMAEISGGDITLIAREGIEATYVKINDGNIKITATDDGINAGNKSNAYEVTIEINGGNITIDMGQGDTDAIDSNGNLYINGGTINITAKSPFDYDKEGLYKGGTITVNGEKTTTLSNQQMGGNNFQRGRW